MSPNSSLACSGVQVIEDLITYLIAGRIFLARRMEILSLNRPQDLKWGGAPSRPKAATAKRRLGAG